jgi:preprotein translocase subunit SecD
VQLILAWPVRMLIIGILIFSIAIDGAGYIYRFANKCPLQGACEGLPPNYFGWNLFIHKGLDLAGGTHIDYQLTGFPAGQSRADVQQRTINVIEKRVNALGVSEPEIRGAGANNDRITIDLAGVNADQAEKAIGRITKLVYTKWVKDPKQDPTNPAGPVHPGYKPQLVGLSGDDIQSASASLDQNGVNWVVNITFTSHGGDVFSNLTSANVAACPGDPTTDQTGASSCPERYLSTWMDLTQNDINHWDDAGYAAQLVRPWDAPPNPTDPQPKLLIDAITLQQISGGQAQISGNFTQQSANDLATGINSGALPVTLQVLDVTQVGSTLGAQSVNLSLAAGLLGLAIVVIFMIVYYRALGLLASLALLFYAGAVFALFKAIPVTLTLAGITGFILSVGMAVDANGLIFERFKEEVRAGRTIPAAVDAAVRRAWPAIRDSNTSTLLTCAILLFVGPAQIKGFAIVLAIGVLASLFSSIFVTHNLLAIVLSWASARRPGLLGVSRARAL